MCKFVPLDFTFCQVNELITHNIALATNKIEPFRTQLTKSQCLFVSRRYPFESDTDNAVV